MLFNKPFTFKKATVTIRADIPKPLTFKNYQVFQKELKHYQAEIKKYKREDPNWKYWKTHIRRLRKDFFPESKTVYIEFYFQMGREAQSFAMTFENTPYLMQSIRQALSDYYRSFIRNIRQRNKLRETPVPWSLGVATVFSTKNKGRVFSKPNQILKIYVEKNVKNLYVPKKPENNANHIGVEIEFCASISEENLALQLFRSGLHKFTELKKDGSLRPIAGEHGYELAMIFREGNYKKELKRVCSFLESIKATATDRRCGLHVHLDMRKRNKELVYHNLVSAQNALWRIVDPRRYDGEFCRIVKDKKFPKSFTGDRQERYKTINAASYFRHKTLEIRMHEGSIDFASISNWIDVLLKIANYKKKVVGQIQELEKLKKRFNLRDKTYRQLVDKSCYWQVNFSEDARQIPTQVQQADLNEPELDLNTAVFVPNIAFQTNRG